LREIFRKRRVANHPVTYVEDASGVSVIDFAERLRFVIEDSGDQLLIVAMWICYGSNLTSLEHPELEGYGCQDVPRQITPEF
jgi:hypothetical protein